VPAFDGLAALEKSACHLFIFIEDQKIYNKIYDIHSWILPVTPPEPWSCNIRETMGRVYVLRKWIMDGEPVHRICLYMACTGKEYAKGKRSGKCKESFVFAVRLVHTKVVSFCLNIFCIIYYIN